MTISTPVYTTREAVKTAADIKEGARSNTVIDDILESVSRQVEGETHRRFYAELTTRYFDWPNNQLANPWQIYLESNEIVEATELTIAGSVVASGYLLRRSDGKEEPPYDLLEMDLSGSASLSSGSTHQRAIALRGFYGFNDGTAPAGTLDGNINASVTTLAVSNSAVVGVGSTLRIESERLLVTGKSMVDTTLNLLNTLTASVADRIVTVSDGTLFSTDEVILIDAERMRIVDIAGNNLIVIRSWDGSALAAHSIAADIYVPRTLTVVRGFLGTTAASHTTAAALSTVKYEGLISDYSLALALTDNRLRQTGYTPEMYGNKALAEKAAAVYTAYARKMRSGAV